MMGRRDRDQGKLFYDFKLDDMVPKDHLLRRMDVFVTTALGDLHAQLKPFYSDIGRPGSDKKMGGRGSGRPAGLGLMVDLCHRSHSIDLGWLNRKKLLNPGQWSSLRWSVRGQETGSIKVTLVGGGVKLNYRARQRGEDWQQIEEVIPLVETTTNFAGRRQWFQCLSCSRRCQIIYGGIWFRCRKCQGLRYESQYEPSFARAASRALKIRDKLGGRGGLDEPFPVKPKGMRWRTYKRLEAQDEQLQRAWARGISAHFRMFEGED